MPRRCRATSVSQSLASAAPEPGTWTLTIAGFALAGVALRRRRVALSDVS